MRFEVPASSALVFSDADGRVLEEPVVHRLSRTVQTPALDGWT